MCVYKIFRVSPESWHHSLNSKTVSWQNSFFFTEVSLFLKVFNWLDKANPHWGGGNLLFSKPVDWSLLNPSKNTFTATSIFDQLSGHCDLAKLTYEINLHSSLNYPDSFLSILFCTFKILFNAGWKLLDWFKDSLMGMQPENLGNMSLGAHLGEPHRLSCAILGGRRSKNDLLHSRCTVLWSFEKSQVEW